MFTLTDFVRESNRIEGIEREPTQEEIDAHTILLHQKQVGVGDVSVFVGIAQPGATLRALPGLDVRVGGFLPPPGGPFIEKSLRSMLDVPPRVTSTAIWQWHLDYERLHPFTDGNGRSGRALWLRHVGGDAPLGFLHTFYYQTLKGTE